MSFSIIKAKEVEVLQKRMKAYTQNELVSFWFPFPFSTKRETKDLSAESNSLVRRKGKLVKG
jgi:hypothetical protein